MDGYHFDGLGESYPGGSYLRGSYLRGSYPSGCFSIKRTNLVEELTWRMFDGSGLLLGLSPGLVSGLLPGFPS